MYLDIFENTSFYLFCVSIHMEMTFSVSENKAFVKRSLGWIFLKMPFSCCHVDG